MDHVFGVCWTSKTFGKEDVDHSVQLDTTRCQSRLHKEDVETTDQRENEEGKGHYINDPRSHRVKD